MVDIIDYLIVQCGTNSLDQTQVPTVQDDSYLVYSGEGRPMPDVPRDEVIALPPNTDIFNANKTYGHLCFADHNFNFIGPDKEPVHIDTIDDLIKVANQVLDTGVPNYKGARIPIVSKLNVAAWEAYAADYGDKRIVDYIKFGMPLSIDPHRDKLCSQSIQNHHSAIQHPQAVSDYIEKELSFGALLGPMTSIPHSTFHCSPLMTRPKDAASAELYWICHIPKSALSTHLSIGTLLMAAHSD